MMRKNKDEGEEDIPIKKTIRRGLTSSEKTDLTEVFALVDSNSSGMIDWVELRRALRGLGFAVSKKESRTLLRQADKHDEIGLLDCHQFLEIVETLSLMDHDRHRELLGGYRLFDKANDGGITIVDLKRVAAEVCSTAWCAACTLSARSWLHAKHVACSTVARSTL